MPSPVAIITTSVSSNAPISDYHGLTVSSMTSLSLNPDPLILFNVMVPSRSSESLKAFDLFGVHLLKPSSYSIDLVRKFSQGHRSGGLITSPFDGLLKDYDFFHYDGLTKNSKLENTGGILPLLMHCDKILVCKKKNFFEVADHEIWVGEVVDTIISKHGSKSDGNLLHFNSEFYRVGTKIWFPAPPPPLTSGMHSILSFFLSLCCPPAWRWSTYTSVGCREKCLKWPDVVSCLAEWAIYKGQPYKKRNALRRREETTSVYKMVWLDIIPLVLSSSLSFPL